MTVTSSTLSSLLVFFVGFGLVTFALRLWKRRIPGVRGRTAVTAATYFLRYAAALEYYGLRAAEIEAHVDALRADLASLDDDELRHALSGLGAPRTLAAAVAGDVRRPTPLRGVVWLGLAALLVMGLAVLLTESFLGGFEPHAPVGAHDSWSMPGMMVEATMGPGGRATMIGFGGWFFVVVPLVAFVIGSRVWRVRDRR